MEDTKHCTPCKTKDKETKPEFYCTDCEAYYCEDCFELHLRVPYLAKHIVLKHDDIDIWSRDQYKCTSHGKNLEFFCKEHTMLCCHVCISLKHRSCTDMEYILESAMQNNLEDDVKDMMRQIEEQLRIIESCADKVREKTESNQTSRSGYIKELESFRSRINEMFDSLIEKSFEEVKEKFDQNDYYSDNVRQTLTRFEGKLKEFEQLLKSTAVGKEPLVYISLKRAEILVAEFSRELSKLDFSSDKEKYKPVIDDTIEGYVKNIKQIAVIEDERMIQERVASESLSEKDDTCSSEEEVQPSFSNSRRVTEVQPSFSSSRFLSVSFKTYLLKDAFQKLQLRYQLLRKPLFELYFQDQGNKQARRQ
ncbi:E3 ubiquitin/ISG15 ligase TRIM25-like [Ruditapes philippinarum]|uniref:E3 ubiquitin/ISG15 ligase TRIM25-like n=1 Tax=Ruditapes philippinarum TaxID=129788 RepID=UPI00295A6EBA|nr:E3 ubiquitin/ISG15 ligase TRIM25-like [Ruditapes philippinarum]